MPSLFLMSYFQSFQSGFVPLYGHDICDMAFYQFTFRQAWPGIGLGLLYSYRSPCVYYSAGAGTVFNEVKISKSGSIKVKRITA